MPEEAVVEAPTGAPEATAEPPKPQEKLYTPDEIREKIQSGELRKEIGDQDPQKWMETHIRVEAPPAPVEEPKKPEEPQAPPEEPKEAQEAPKEKKPRKPKDPEPDTGSFLKQLQERGFKYDTPEKALDGYVNKERAVETYRSEAKQLRQREGEVRSELEREKQSRKELETRLKEVEAKISAPAPEPVRPEIPELPELDSLNDPELKSAIAKRDAALLETTRQEVDRLRREFEQRTAKAESAAQQLAREFNQIQLANKNNELLQHQQRVKENAFRAAEDLMGKVDEYKLAKPIEKVYDEYSSVLEEVAAIQDMNPAYRGRDLLAEYATGNPSVVSEFNRRGLELSDDVQKYMVMAQLESDCYLGRDANGRLTPNPVLFKDGRPNLVAALRLREESDGILQQRLANAEMKGYDKAQTVMDTVASAPATIPTSEGSETVPAPKMTAEQALNRMREIKNLPPAQHKAAMDELRKHLDKIPELQVT